MIPPFQVVFVGRRKKDNTLPSFFVKSGTSFFNNGIGFESDNPITIYVNGSKGVVITEGATIKLKGSALAGVSFDGNVTVNSNSEDHIEVAHWGKVNIPFNSSRQSRIDLIVIQ